MVKRWTVDGEAPIEIQQNATIKPVTWEGFSNVNPSVCVDQQSNSWVKLKYLTVPMFVA